MLQIHAVGSEFRVVLYRNISDLTGTILAKFNNIEDAENFRDNWEGA